MSQDTSINPTGGNATNATTWPPDSNTSPKRLTGTASMNFLSESKVDSSREAVKGDLVGKITYDDPTVFARLGVNRVDGNVVSACAQSLTTEKKTEIETLKKIAAKALGKLQAGEVIDGASAKGKREKSGNRGSSDEKSMYNPLLKLFTHISHFDEATRPLRTFHHTKGMLQPDEPHTLGFTITSPDITISPSDVNVSKSRKWRDRDAFGEVKASKTDSPKPVNEGTIPAIVAQSADYARLFMSARPFMLFCVVIMIFGTEFCIGIFDRDGITFSPIHDMFNDTRMFVRVVRRLACDTTMEDIGWDPTVTALSDKETERLTGQDKYPSAIISSIGRDQRKWCTIGPPIWCSLSLLGRGTHVWLVREYVPGDGESLSCLKGDEMIMKTAWRNSGRTPESQIYSSIHPPIPGLASFECGGDVLFPKVTGHPITVRNLRNGPDNRNFLSDYDFEDSTLPATPILHRLILKTVGRAMWTYKTDLDLLTGFRDALQAHQRLYNQGILHRDISAGNVLLSKDDTAPFRGFITDLDFAYIKEGTIQQPEVTTHTSVVQQHKFLSPEPMTRTHKIFKTEVTVKRQANITGTIQFMSLALLKQAVSSKTNKQPGFVHTANDDVQSFIWVLSYCVMRSLYDRASRKDALQDVDPPKDIQDLLRKFRRLFRTAFGETELDKLVQARHHESVALAFPTNSKAEELVERFMTKALISLFEDLQSLLSDALSHKNPIPVTHDSLLEQINKAITTLEADCSGSST